MNVDELKKIWLEEEAYVFKGWDFSHIRGRYDGEGIPWDYGSIVLSHLNDKYRLLDMGTGGGEFLLSLNHPHNLTCVTEAYPPNVELCRERLEPLGIIVKQIYEDDNLPFEDEYFDIVINRHEYYEESEVSRVLKKGGLFITQQIGGKNNYDLSCRLIDDFKPQFPEFDMKNAADKLEKNGFKILDGEESFIPVRFYDIGAFVYFAKIIQWEFPGFSVESCFDKLCDLQKDIEENGVMQGTEHRFIIVSTKL